MATPQRLVRIDYIYEFIDQSGSFDDLVYMRENTFINYDDKDVLTKIINNFLNDTDKSKILKEVKDVKYLGVRLI